MNDEIEYQELSADWRHRDSLTWQMPAVIVAVTGLLVSKGFELIDSIDPVIFRAIFIFTTAFAVCLTFALWQNLRIQGEGSCKMKSLYCKTERFNFSRLGSFFLLALCVLLSVGLIILSFMTMLEPLQYWKPVILETVKQ